MLKIKQIKLRKLKQFFEKIPIILAEKSFLTFLVLLLFFLVLSSFIFYKYSILAGKAKPEISEKPLIFKEKTYETILQTWQERKEKFEGADKKEYPNLFKSLTP